MPFLLFVLILLTPVDSYAAGPWATFCKFLGISRGENYRALVDEEAYAEESRLKKRFDQGDAVQAMRAFSGRPIDLRAAWKIKAAADVEDLLRNGGAVKAYARLRGKFGRFFLTYRRTLTLKKELDARNAAGTDTTEIQKELTRDLRKLQNQSDWMMATHNSILRIIREELDGLDQVFQYQTYGFVLNYDEIMSFLPDATEDGLRKLIASKFPPDTTHEIPDLLIQAVRLLEKLTPEKLKIQSPLFPSGFRWYGYADHEALLKPYPKIELNFLRRLEILEGLYSFILFAPTDYVFVRIARFLRIPGLEKFLNAEKRRMKYRQAFAEFSLDSGDPVERLQYWMRVISIQNTETQDFSVEGAIMFVRMKHDFMSMRAWLRLYGTAKKLANEGIMVKIDGVDSMVVDESYLKLMNKGTAALEEKGPISARMTPFANSQLVSMVLRWASLGGVGVLADSVFKLFGDSGPSLTKKDRRIASVKTPSRFQEAVPLESTMTNADWEPADSQNAAESLLAEDIEFTEEQYLELETLFGWYKHAREIFPARK